MLKAIAICAVLMLAGVSPALSEDAPQTTSDAAAADDVPQAVKDACQGDYDKHCSKHGHDKQAVRVCMAGVFEKLSDPCVTAILDSPLADDPDAAGAKEDAQSSTATAQSEQTSRAARAGSTAVHQIAHRDRAPRAGRAAHTARKTAASPKAHSAPARKKTKLAANKPAKRALSATAGKRAPSVKPAKRTLTAKLQARPRERKTVHRRGGEKRRNVAGYIKRGTGIANYYVAKYTRFAFAKAFR